MFSRTIPNWSKVQEAVASTVRDGAQLQAEACESSAAVSDAQREPIYQEEIWSSAMEAAVTAILLWAQSATATRPQEHKPGKLQLLCRNLRVFLPTCLSSRKNLLYLAQLPG